METAVFAIFALIAVASGVVVVAHRNPVYSTMSLVVTLFAVAVLFVLLGAPFLAALQILIYAGAVTVLLVFAIMLTRVRDLQERFEGEQWPLGLAASLGLLGAFIAMWSQTEWPRDVDEITVVPFASMRSTDCCPPTNAGPTPTNRAPPTTTTSPAAKSGSAISVTV